MTLITGNQYDVTNLICTGWTFGDGSGHDGYNVSDYFTADGIFKGPDEHGIQPEFRAPQSTRPHWYQPAGESCLHPDQCESDGGARVV